MQDETRRPAAAVTSPRVLRELAIATRRRTELPGTGWFARWMPRLILAGPARDLIHADARNPQPCTISAAGCYRCGALRSAGEHPISKLRASWRTGPMAVWWPTSCTCCGQDGSRVCPAAAMPSCPVAASAITWCDCGQWWRRARSRRHVRPGRAEGPPPPFRRRRGRRRVSSVRTRSKPAVLNAFRGSDAGGGLAGLNRGPVRWRIE